MKYYLSGHDRGGGVQEMLISLLPDEEHILCETREEADCLSLLREEAGMLIAEAQVTLGGKTTCETCIRPAPEADTEEHKRVRTYAVKTALYQALLPHLERKPVWGSLTGVKPAKPVRLALNEGMKPGEVLDWLEQQYDVSESRRKLCLATAVAAWKTEKSLLPRETQLYIGIPFCPAKCSYCSFVSNDMAHFGHLIAPYVEALLREVEAAGEMVRRAGIPIGSIYIGGGTPTTLNEEQLERLLCAVDAAFDRTHCREYTVEAGRPETITRRKLELLKEHGVGRISINPQTMDDAVLAGVGRRHTAQDIRDCFAMARQVGDFLINMDLIAGLPGDTEEGLFESLQQVTALDPDHVTIHCLARKKGARLRFGPTGDLDPAALDKCYAHLAERNYVPYYLYRQKYIAGGLENVGFCRPGTASHYNICMMEELSDVIALGSGGVTKLCAEGGRKIFRLANHKYPKEYIENIDEILRKKRELYENP